MPLAPITHHAPSFLQVIAVSDYKRQPPVGYFSLPAEIRNKIMKLLFGRSEILLVTPKPTEREHKPSLFRSTEMLHSAIQEVRSRIDPKSRRALQPPGFQLLATCKQACAEGHAIFYSSSAFYLPSGPLSNAHRALETLQPQHRMLIKWVCVRLDIQDLTPLVFEEIHDEMRLLYGNHLTNHRHGGGAQGVDWGRLAKMQLLRIWREKTAYVLTHWEGSLVLEDETTAYSGEGSEGEEGEEDVEEVAGFFDEGGQQVFWTLEMRKHVWRVARLFGTHIEYVVRRDGWKAVRAMARKGWPPPGK